MKHWQKWDHICAGVFQGISGSGTQLRSWIYDIPDHDLAAHQSRLWRDVFRAREIQTLSSSKADKLPNFPSDDLLVASIVRAIARGLAGIIRCSICEAFSWLYITGHCVFVVRSRSDQPAHFCDHPLCPGAPTQPETMWLSIEPFIDWGTLEPAKPGIFGEVILVFKRNVVSGAGGYHLKDYASYPDEVLLSLSWRSLGSETCYRATSICFSQASERFLTTIAPFQY